MSDECPAGCCPHDSIAREAGCPADLPQAPLPERAAHLYACRALSTYRIAAMSTYRIAATTGTDRQRVTRLLHKAGIAVKPRGAGRRKTRTPDEEQLDKFMAVLYLRYRMSSTQIAGITGIPGRTVRERLGACGVPMRTRGRWNREDRITISPDDLSALYVKAGLSAGEAGRALGVSRRVVLRSAHDHGLPVRVGGPPPARGPSQIELLTALYADPQVRRVLNRHGIPMVQEAGLIWERFPVPHRLTPPSWSSTCTKAAGSACTTSSCSPAGQPQPLARCCVPAASGCAPLEVGPRSCAAGAKARPDACHASWPGRQATATGSYNSLPWRLGLVTQANSTC